MDVPKMQYVSGSDELLDIYCEPCINDGHNIEATGFCSSCQEYLCQLCIDYHRKATPSKHHSILHDTHIMMQKRPNATTAKNIEKCPVHKSKFIEYYCKNHDHLVCHVCMTTGHRTCEYIHFIPDIDHGNDEYTKLIAILDQMTRCAFDNQRKAAENIKLCEKYRYDATARIRGLRQEINIVFDKLENDMIKEATLLKDDDIQKMDTISKACDILTSDITTSTSNIKYKHNATDQIQLCVAVKRTEMKLASFEATLSCIADSNTVQRYWFEPDKRIKLMLETVRTLGKLSRPKTKATFVGDIRVKPMLYRKDCYITGMTVVSDDRLVIVDQGTECVKLIDVDKNKVLSEKALSSTPFDVTTVSSHQVAVTLPSKNLIQFLGVSDTLTMQHDIPVDGKVYGIGYCSQTIIAVLSTQVQVLNMRGDVLRTIQYGINGQPLFKDLRRVVISPDCTTIYVADEGTKTVTSLTLDTGRVMAAFKDTYLSYPVDLTVDSYGYVYVCNGASDMIHQLTPELTKVQELLGPEDGLHCPKSVAYCINTAELYVGMNRSDSLNVFKLE